MELLRKYCLSICCINDLDTYIISPVEYDTFMANQELLEYFNVTSCITTHLIQTAKKVDALYFAFTHHKGMAGLRLEWWPVLCYKNKNTFFHVNYRNSWMCRECGYKLRVPMIMPMSEIMPDFYYGTRNKFPDTPPIFQKLPCPRCSKLLQNHLIILD